MTTTIPLVTNSSIPTAPPSYFFPSAAGRAIPAGLTRWALDIDQTNVPAVASYELHMEFLYSGGWREDAGQVFGGGPIPNGSGGHTFINHIESTIGSLDANNQPIGERPTTARIRVASVGNWIFPTLTLTVS